MGNTIGEHRIRVNLDVEPKDLIEKMKHKSAELINLISEIEDQDDLYETKGEVGRLKSLAMTGVEDSSVWMTKAVTCKRK